MKTIGEAVQEFRKRYPTVSANDLKIFIMGWTAHEIAVEAEKLLIKKAN